MVLEVKAHGGRWLGTLQKRSSHPECLFLLPALPHPPFLPPVSPEAVRPSPLPQSAQREDDEDEDLHDDTLPLNE